MTGDFKKILQTLEQRNYAPVYLIDGEEPFYLDMLTEYFEDKILQPAERDYMRIFPGLFARKVHGRW